MGQSSFGGGSLKSASSRSSAARSLQSFLALPNDSVDTQRRNTWHAYTTYTSLD
jgi:hypothetical protein